MNEYVEEDGVLKYTKNTVKEAVAWQGYDKYVNIDNYEKEVLEAGTKLVKLEPSESGYFTTLDTYESEGLKENIGLEKRRFLKLKGDARNTNEGLQVAPRKTKFKDFYDECVRAEAEKLKPNLEGEQFENFYKEFKKECLETPDKLKNNYKLNKVKEFYKDKNLDRLTDENKEVTIYDYRAKISVYKLTHDVEVAKGKAFANKDYGLAGGGDKNEYITQIYIGGYNGSDPEKNKASGLIEESRTEKLNYFLLSEKQYLHIMARHEQQVLKRNYFCYLKQESDLLELRKETDDYEVKAECSEKLEEINKKVKCLKEDLIVSFESIGDIKSSTYDKKIDYLTQKTKSMKAGQKFQKDTKKEMDIKKVNKNIMDKVSKEIELISSGEINIENRNERINIDELRKAYKNDLYIKLEKNIQLHRENDRKIDRINKEISDFNKKGEVLKQAKKCFENIEKYEKVAKKFDNKVFFRKSYQKKHKKEKGIYESSKKYLKNKGLEDKDKYLKEIEKLKKEAIPKAKKNIKILEKIKSKNEKINKEIDSLKNEFNEIEDKFISLEDKFKKLKQFEEKLRREKIQARGLSR